MATFDPENANSSGGLVAIAVGSKNPVKINAALNGAKKAFANQGSSREFKAIGFNSPSGVSDQPMGDAETKLGAWNRAKAAYNACISQDGENLDFAVGLEGGVLLSEDTGELECFAWIAVYDGKVTGYSRTASFALPPAIRDLVLGRVKIEGGTTTGESAFMPPMELGDADDKVFGSSNSKQQGGTVGHLTQGVIDRAQYYEHAVVLAFVPFFWPELYPPTPSPSTTSA